MKNIKLQTKTVIDTGELSYYREIESQMEIAQRIIFEKLGYNASSSRIHRQVEELIEFYEKKLTEKDENQ